MAKKDTPNISPGGHSDPSAVEQTKKEIVAALRALRVILTQGPRREYPSGLHHHAEVKRLQAEIERALLPHSATLDPRGPFFRDFVPCDVLQLTEIPADWETLKWLDHYIERFGGRRKRPSVPITEEDKLILETLAEAYPAAMNQPDLASFTGLRRPKISERLKWLEDKPRCYVERPKGTQRKGHAITMAGLSAIGRPIESPH